MIEEKFPKKTVRDYLPDNWEGRNFVYSSINPSGTLTGEVYQIMRISVLSSAHLDGLHDDGYDITGYERDHRQAHLSFEEERATFGFPLTYLLGDPEVIEETSEVEVFPHPELDL